jgi:integrase/recombinase XerD
MFLTEMLPSWQLWMRSTNKSPNTIDNYTRGVNAFIRWCDTKNIEPTLTKPAVQAFVADLLDNGAQATTAKTRQYALKAFSKWLAAEGEIDTDQLHGIKLVRLDQKVTPALTDRQINNLIAACTGNDLVARRDEALIRFMVETGTRAREVTALKITDINLDSRIAIIHRGKGGKGRTTTFSPQCAAALDRYLRARRRIVLAPHVGPLWVGPRASGFGYHSLQKALQRRARQAGIEGFHLHLFRHTAATRWLRAGGSETGLMAMAGWSTRAMIDRYTGASASERSIQEAEKLNLGDF